MTYRELCQCLQNGNIENAEWDAACLLEHCCNTDPLSLRLNPEKDYDSPSLTDAVHRRLAREPLQYIIGEWQFYRQTYEVSPDCLIPRSDTEILVEEAIRLLPHGARFADLCTGSGCSAISILAERSDTCAVALEKFPNTLSLAMRNAQKNGVGERFTPLLANVLEAPPTALIAPPLHAIVSNPPYIATRELDALSPEVHAEPQAALDGGDDGLLFYRAILEHYEECLTPDGFFLFEIGYDQKDALLSLAREHGFAHTHVIRDLGGNDRVVYLSKNIPYERKKLI